MPSCVFSQYSSPDTAIATFTNTEIKLDGVLDEPIWNIAKKYSNFHQRETLEGQEITEKTEVAIVFNKNKLWIGAWCWDSDPNGIVAKEMIRDFYYWRDDNFEIIFDTYLDKRNGYVFVVNPNGAMADVQITNEGDGFNRDWNAVWDAKTQVNENGWFLEMEIPFSSLKFPDKENQVWGVNFERNIRRKQEQAFWQGWSRNYDFEHVSHAGTLIGLKNIEGNELLDFKPYLSSGLQTSPGKDLKTLGKIGGDANIYITPSIKLNLTINTDFAQVESDQLQYNLSRFNLYYPEKRDFFLEGKDFFDFNINSNTRVFYSRRIGLNEDGSEHPILGGMKLTGNYGRTSIGLLSIQDNESEKTPTTNHSVIRIKQGILEKSSIGMIFTTMNNNHSNNHVFGLDFLYATSKLFGNKNFSISGNVSQSLNNKIEEDNLAYSLSTNFRNDMISTGITFVNIQDNYNPKLGFLNRKNFKELAYDFNYRLRADWIPFAQFIMISPLNIASYFTNTTNDLESLSFKTIPFSILTKGGDAISFIYKRDYDRADEPILSLKRPEGKYWFGKYGIDISTFEGRMWKAEFGYFQGTYYDGKTNDLYTSFRINLTNQYALFFNYEHTDIDFSDFFIEKNYFSITAEAGITPKLFTNIYAQWLNLTNEIIVNYRLHWNPVPGSDVFFVINQNYSAINKEISLKNTTILAKIIWRFPVII